MSIYIVEFWGLSPADDSLGMPYWRSVEASSRSQARIKFLNYAKRQKWRNEKIKITRIYKDTIKRTSVDIR